ncbi:hypothetical protein K469DRAFT_613312, partial [Zopfia rhizophila CBS 207.26]
DLSEDIDAVIITGTRLRTPTARKFTQYLCKAVKSGNGVTVWINDERPMIGSAFRNVLNH